MNQDDFVIFAKLNRLKFDEILQTLTRHFESVDHGRQGDDWIKVQLTDDSIEIDSFYSMNLEIKGKYQHLPVVQNILQELQADCILQVFDPPKMDTTR